MKPDVYICGCSFSSGFYRKESNPFVAGQFIPYPEIFCSIKELTFVNLSFPGASNYAITKQVEFAITQKPKLIIVNLTTSGRLDWTHSNKRLAAAPTLRDITYNQSSDHPLLNASNTILSMPIATMINEDNVDSIVAEYIAEYIDIRLLSDKDRLLILGMFSLLDGSTIPYLAVNFSKKLGKKIRPEVYDVSLLSLINNYPIPTDDCHFNQLGHQYIAQLLVANYVGD